MRKHLKKIRSSRVTKEELVADLIFLFISGFISGLVVFLFDIHQSFYSWPIKLKFIFTSWQPFILFTLIGTIIIFFLLKLLLFGFKEENF